MDKQNNKTIAVLGAGSWGTALALLLAGNGYPVLFWGKDSARMARMAHDNENSVYLPGYPFPESLKVNDDLEDITATTGNVVIAVPSHAFRATLNAIVPGLSPDASISWASKGLETGSGKVLSQVFSEICSDRIQSSVISGPTFASEVAKGLPTVLTVASENAKTAANVASWLRNDRVRVYTNNDVIGVQLGGAIKNVMAIAAGISDGLGFGVNARAALITRGLAELQRLGIAMGGKPETFSGLTGAGDLILTCTDNLSRNRRVGLGLGQGRALSEILAELGQEAEGVSTAKELLQVARAHKVDMPITEQVYKVLYEHLAPKKAVEALFERQARSE